MKLKTLIIAAALTFSASVMAGKSIDSNVEIDMELMSAMGNMKTARFSKNDEELIGCGTRTAINADGSVFQWGFCQASLSDEEENAFCFTQDANLITEINAISAFSYITFRWDENGDCTYIGHSTQSFYLPGKKFK